MSCDDACRIEVGRSRRQTDLCFLDHLEKERNNGTRSPIRILFARSDTGGERTAAIYGLLGSAKLNGHNPEAFPREVIARIAEHSITRINELLPWHLQPTHTNPLTGNGATPKLPPNG